MDSLTAKDLTELQELLNSYKKELQEERDEVMKLMKLIHHYESILLSLSLQVSLGGLNRQPVEKAFSFAERVTTKTLETLYQDQNTLSSLDEDLLEFTKINKPPKGEVH
tara:strand:+ start:3390 stop:3716 length:327 start_codon:yes stop_codon:yes gene_type:complete